MRTLALRTAAALAAVPLLLTGCSGDNVDVETPDVNVTPGNIDVSPGTVPDVEVTPGELPDVNVESS